MSYQCIGGVLISHPKATQPLGGLFIARYSSVTTLTAENAAKSTEPVTHGRYDATLWLPSQPQSTVTAPWPVLISHPAERRRLRWPEWRVTYEDVIPVNGQKLSITAFIAAVFSF